MLLSACRDGRRELDGRCCRDRAPADGDTDRGRTRERLEATLSGLGELDYLRQRQEVLVRTVLDLREETGREEKKKEKEEKEENYLSSEEKLLEENILLLRKQLNCLRRRDAGLISQLQELDRQISDLRLDSDVSHDQETDSRPSSGFYELSDGASGSLSNSSNSVFSECFCSTADADGRLPSTDELASCLECEGLVGGLGDDQSSSGTVRRSLSVPYPPTLDPPTAPCDSQSKYHFDLVARNGSDVYRYPSPLHAVAVQSPIFFQMLGGGHSNKEGLSKSGDTGVNPDLLSPPSVLAPLVPQSSSWPAPSSSSSCQTPSHKHLDSYIYSLLQRRAQPIRTNRPRTSINTDPSKSILRQASLCVRPGSGSGPGLVTLRGSELKTFWQTCGAAGGGTASPQRQWSTESRGEEQESGGCQTQNGIPSSNSDMLQNSDLVQKQNVYSVSNAGVQNGCALNNSVQNGYSINNSDLHMNTNSLLMKKGLSSATKGLLPPSSTSSGTLSKDYRELGSLKANSSPKEQPCYPPTLTTDQEPPLESPQIVKIQSATPKKSPKSLPSGHTGKGDRSIPELVSLGSSSQSQDEGGGGSHTGNAECIPVQRQAIKLRKGGNKNIKIVKMKNTTVMKVGRASEHAEPTSERKGDKQKHRSGSRKSRISEDVSSTHHRVSKRATGGGAPGVSTSRIKRIPASIPEGQVLEKNATSTMTSVTCSRSGISRHHHHNHHGNNHSNHHHHGHHHHHGRDPVVVVAKPKYKRNDYRRLRAITEVPYDEAFRRVQRRQRKELLNQAAANRYLPSTGQVNSPYSYVAGSDSEYSAECASLFHSTIMDTSEDERSNYTTNCFGDSESSMSEEFIEESTTTSDSEESGGGGAGGTSGMGRGWSQFGAPGTGPGGQEVTPAQAKAFVKIKASHNLKKKILRFRSGSLKLMTTV